MRLVEILQGWALFAQGSPETKQLMTKRLAICDTCPSKMQMSPAGQWLVKAINQKSSTFICRECGCPLAGKTALKSGGCPLGKWKSVLTDPTYYP